MVSTRQSLESHLLSNQTCADLYMREYKVRTLNAMLIKCFPCLNCSITRNFKLKKHLEENQQCLNYYKRKFGAESIDDIIKILRNLQRQSQPSRQPTQRRLNYQNKEKESITVSEAINNFKRSIALSNYRLCCICHGHYLESSTIEIDNDHALYKEKELEKNLQLRRMNKFYCCKMCLSSNDTPDQRVIEPILKVLAINGQKILYPKETNDSANILDSEFNNKTLILVPKNTNFKIKVQKLPVNIYKCKPLTNSFLSTMYNNQVYKYYQKKTLIERYEGTIENLQSKLLTNIKPIVDISEIRNSETWVTSKITGLQARFDQFGPAALAFAIPLEINSPETISTALLVKGDVLTIEYQG